MDCLHVVNLEKYHPKYKDRELVWCKAYFKMLNADPEFEMLCEIDKWRFIAFVMLELQIKQPVSLDPEYLKRKGFDLRKRSISLSIKMLHKLVIVVPGSEKSCSTDKDKEEDKEKRKIAVTEKPVTEKPLSLFDIFWQAYPRKVGKPTARKWWVKNEPDKELTGLMVSALIVQSKTEGWTKEKGRFIPHTTTWLNREGWNDVLEAEAAAIPLCHCGKPGIVWNEIRGVKKGYCQEHRKK